MAQQTVSSHRILYEYKQSQTNAYVWILQCFGWFLLVCLTWGLLAAPFYLAWTLNWLWAVAALVSVPVGVLGFLVLLKIARKQLKRNRHPECYRLTTEALEYRRPDYAKSDKGKKSKKQQALPYHQVEAVVISIYALLDYEEKEAGKLSEQQFRERLYPCLHFLVSRGGYTEASGMAGTADASTATRHEQEIISVPLTEPIRLHEILELFITKRLPLFLAPVSIRLGKEQVLSQWLADSMLWQLGAAQPFYPTMYELFMETRVKYRKIYQHIQPKLPDGWAQQAAISATSATSRKRRGSKQGAFPFAWIGAGFLALLLLGELGVLRLTSLWTGWLILIPAFLAYASARRPDLRRPIVFAVLCAGIATAVMAAGYFILNIGKEPVITEMLVSIFLFLPVSYLLYFVILILKKRSSTAVRKSRVRL